MANKTPSGLPSREEAEAAVRTLIRWAGEDPSREGLLKTPSRVVQAWQEHYSGYSQDPAGPLRSTFQDGIGAYSEPVVLTDIEFQSHCEHHLEPIIGTISVGYLPNGKIVGLSKIVRACEIFFRRMQTQEALTLQIARTLEQNLAPRGVAVWICAKHYCMISRGIRSPRPYTQTSCFIGEYDTPQYREAFLRSCQPPQR